MRFVASFCLFRKFLKAQELKDYLTSLGASFDETTSGEVDVAKIIQAVANSFSICMAKASDEGAAVHTEFMLEKMRDLNFN